MNYINKLKEVSVLGAAGKMGSGILLLTAMEMTDVSLEAENRKEIFILNAIDISHKALNGLLNYIKIQVTKAAEKKINFLRKIYSDRKDLIENGEIIQQYLADVMMIIKPSVKIENSYDSQIIFEAITENPEIKASVLKQIDKNSSQKPWFFTNTSSIPISKLDEMAGLEGRIFGLHFYNPPAVQKLVETIKGKNTLPELEEFALHFTKKLRKTVVPSSDCAGFIGNGHFMRDALHGISEAEKYSDTMPLYESIFTINEISANYLVRPMGIFQLIDYVGIEVCSYIMSVMNPHYDDNLHSSLLDKMLSQGIKGGQNADGSQKNGFFQYEKGRIVSVYDLGKKEYIRTEEFINDYMSFIGTSDIQMPKWKEVIKSKDKENILLDYFNKLKKEKNNGAKIAINYGKRSCEIGKKLVKDGIAFTENDVNTVLLTGFFHAYGPINDYFL